MQQTVPTGPEPRALASGDAGGRLWSAAGGLRRAAADWFWLRANLAWENHDAEATRQELERTVSADGEPVYFWVNGARMLAYDLPAWDDARQRGEPEARRRQRHAAAAHEALHWLERGTAAQAGIAEFQVERATIALHGLGDVAAAAEYFRVAAECPDAPYYAARRHAQLLEALGRKREALVWLRARLPHLPATVPEARRAAVAEWVARLETELAAR